MRQVRTIFQPGTVIEVPDGEYQVLAASGLLVPDADAAAPNAEQASHVPTAEPPADTADAPPAGADTTRKKS